MNKKEIKSTTSVKSRRSSKSEMSTVSVGCSERRSFFDNNEEMFLNFNVYLPTLCEKFMCPIPVKVIKNYLSPKDDYVKLKPSEKHKTRTISFVGPTLVSASPSEAKTDDKTNIFETTITASEYQNHAIHVLAYYDALNRLAEIYLHKLKTLPRILMQCLGLLVPHYQQLTKFSIIDSRIDKYTVYELSKMLLSSWITDICLDGCPLSEGNYAILLNKSRLKTLSLCRCLVNDEVCKKISEKLTFPQTAEKNLLILNLSSNHITDVGISYLSEALRTNTHLRYLNLSNNLINDEGASGLFNVLSEFPLRYDEVTGKRRRYIEYLKARQAIRLKYINDFEVKSFDESSRIVKKKPKSSPSLKSKTTAKKDEATSVKSFKSNVDDLVLSRADVLAGELMGPFNDPYSHFSTVVKNGYTYSKGNLTLCYLNLAYNNLSVVSVKKLALILKYQEKVISFNQAGLVMIILDGNYLPNTSNELTTVNDTLTKKIMARTKFFSPVASRKSRRSTTIKH